jgi:chromosome segregation ATPase
MSTAGKVLVVVILLASLVWMILTAGVDQLNRNGNEALIALTEKVESLQADLKNTQDEIVRVKDETYVLQDHMDREVAVINARQNDVQRLASNVTDNLAHVRYELATVQETLQNAIKDRTERAAEAVADQKALDAAKAEYQSLKIMDGQLRERLASLRAQFKQTLNSSAEILHRTVTK